MCPTPGKLLTNNLVSRLPRCGNAGYALSCISRAIQLDFLRHYSGKTQFEFNPQSVTRHWLCLFLEEPVSSPAIDDFEASWDCVDLR
jgi:hypothetical protein